MTPRFINIAERLFGSAATLCLASKVMRAMMNGSDDMDRKQGGGPKDIRVAVIFAKMVL